MELSVHDKVKKREGMKGLSNEQKRVPYHNIFSVRMDGNDNLLQLNLTGTEIVGFLFNPSLI